VERYFKLLTKDTTFLRGYFQDACLEQQLGMTWDMTSNDDLLLLSSLKKVMGT